ncbi:hypothetical protein K340107D12_62910 [Blautia parvula]|uniref:TraG P-loop domain-containing protein n=1 Tax=Blautia parvula TaxID=2877527 RepID=A0ABQ0C3X4_9FIRM
MNAKERFYSGLAKETIGKITSNTDNWTSFLRTMSRNYEFTYPEQVMIYAQRPNATFCKPYEDWNAENYRRYVKRGSTGIALFVMNRDKPYLRYVFDVADTGVRRSSPELKPWEVTPENRSYVMEAMERTFGVAADGVLEAQLEDIASALAAEYWDDYKKQFLDIVANSFLEEYDELNIEVAFKNAVANSVSYTMYCRFVESPDNYFEREYSPLVKAMQGEVIHISATSENHINAMDMNSDYGDGANPVILKSEFILSLCEQLIGGASLGAKQKSIIDRCTASVYRHYQQGNYQGVPPTLQDFREELLKQNEPEAQEIALAIELFTDGSLNTFAKNTNVDTHSRLICYDILDLGKQLQPIGMLVVLDSILNRITQNRAKGRNTFIFIDEIYLLFQHEYSANFLFTLWKRVRKYGAYCTGITQNVDDLLQSHTARTMLANSEFIIMLNQASTDRIELAKLLNISDLQMGYITNVGAGQGLLKVGSSLVPFVNKFPHNTELYKLMTTKFGEV